jgi:predicted DNA-binding transcriptional regulator AlpA
VKKVDRSEALEKLPCILGLQINEAAAFVGVGVTTFRALIKERKMPPPRILGGVKTWDATELRAAYRAIPHDGGPWYLDAPARDDSWDDA